LLGDDPAPHLRIWQINLEDPEDELQRRFAAAAIHYELGAEDIGDRLFLNSGRKVNIVIATEKRDGIVIAVPVIEAIKAEIIDKAIDVLQIDPFVACHSVSENDNTKIAAVARQWADIAEATGCAIELVHHARKGGGGQAFTVDDARGASSLIAAVRSARVLNGMTKDDAERANIDNPTSYFNIGDGKANLAPRGDKATWRHIVGVPLGNGDDPFDRQGDLVGVVEPWSWPDPFAEVSVYDAKEVQRRIAQGEWRENSQSTTWAGSVVADVCGLDMSDKAAKATIRSLIARWVASGALRIVPRKDEKRRNRKFIEVGQWVT
jgi:AAA domain